MRPGPCPRYLTDCLAPVDLSSVSSQGFEAVSSWPLLASPLLLSSATPLPHLPAPCFGTVETALEVSSLPSWPLMHACPCRSPSMALPHSHPCPAKPAPASAVWYKTRVLALCLTIFLSHPPSIFRSFTSLSLHSASPIPFPFLLVSCAGSVLLLSIHSFLSDSSCSYPKLSTNPFLDSLQYFGSGTI